MQDSCNIGLLKMTEAGDAAAVDALTALSGNCYGNLKTLSKQSWICCKSIAACTQLKNTPLV